MYALSLSSSEAPRAPRLPVDSAIRVAVPLVTGLISVCGLIYSVHGRHHTATAIALTGVIMSSIVSAGQAFASERRV